MRTSCFLIPRGGHDKHVLHEAGQAVMGRRGRTVTSFAITPPMACAQSPPQFFAEHYVMTGSHPRSVRKLDRHFVMPASESH
jgi:hypothetical protein